MQNKDGMGLEHVEEDINTCRLSTVDWI